MSLSGADLSGKVLNGSAVFDIVSALQAQIKAAQAGAVLSQDIFTTTAIGYIKDGKTLTAGTKLEDIWSSAFSQYVAPSVTVSISPSTDLYAYPATATIASITGKIVNGADTVTSYAIYDTNNTATTSIAGYKTSKNVTSAVSITADAAKTFYVYASDSKGTVTGSKRIDFCWPYFHGVSTATSRADIDVTTGTKDINKQGSKTYSYEPVGYFYIAYDGTYADLTSIKDNAGNGDETIGEWTKSTTTYEGHTYKVYSTNEQKAAAGTFLFK